MTHPLPLSDDAAVTACSQRAAPRRGGALCREPVERVSQRSALEGRERCPLSCCSTPPAGGAHPRRCPATTPGTRHRNKGRVYPADPPTVDEIVAVMRQTPPDTARAQAPGADRGAVARRAADPGSAVADRVRSRPATRVDPDSPRQREPPPGGRDGRAGRGQIISRHGSPPGSSCRSVRCSA